MLIDDDLLEPRLEYAQRAQSVSKVWLRSGVYTRSLSSFSGDRRVAAHAAGFRVVAVHLQHTALAEANEREMRGIRHVYSQMGWSVVGWATYGQDTDPYDDGWNAARLCNKHFLDGWKANGEAWAEGENAWKSRAWMNGWLAWHRKFMYSPGPVALSCLSSTTANYPRLMDFQPFLDYQGAMISPQVYTADDRNYTVQAMLASFAKAGISRWRLVPTFNVIEAKPLPDYKQQGWVGPRWVWTGDDCRPDRYAQL